MYVHMDCSFCMLRESKRKSEDGARATHACTHAHRHTQEKEKDTWLNWGEGRGFKKKKKTERKVGFQ